MKKVLIVLVVFGLYGMNLAMAQDNGEPEVRAWFTWMQEDGTWHEWVESTKENKDILYNVELKIGQPVKCKIEITPKYDCRVDFEIYPVGVTVPYDPIEGKEMNEIVGFKWVHANETVNYTWVLKPNGNLTGRAAINCYWEVNYNTYVNKEEDYGSFAFANPVILAEEWQGKEDAEDGGAEGGGSGDIAGFEGLLAILGMAAVCILVRGKNGGEGT